jgi:diguanylate cyclase (GGDEF)-like protein
VDRAEPKVIDVSAMRMREATITAGIWLTFGVGAFGSAYVALTWSRPHRSGLAVLFALAMLSAFLVMLLPRERIVRSRWREPFFLAWTCLDFAMLLIGTLADGGTASPLVLVFFIPVVFSSMSYPLGSVVAVGVLSVLSYLALATIAGGSSWAYQGAFAGSLLCTAAMSAWQAQNHNRQHRVLATVSRTDSLTGCLNRRGFEERAEAEISRLARRGCRGAIVVLDIDHFKPVNDTFGHAAGDQLLCWVTQTLQSAVRALDAVGRLGGDEFAVLLPDIDEHAARENATRIEQALRARAPASLGVAVFPDDGTDLELLCRRADARLYASRQRRRGSPAAAPAPASAGRSAISDTSERKLREQAQKRDAATLACIESVEQALLDDRLVLWAQPIVDVRTGVTVKHELLLRMLDHSGQIVSPGEFLPVVEQFALISEIDRWVIKQATRLAGHGCPVQLNLSARSVGDCDVLAHVELCMQQHDVAPELLVFEITETALVEDEQAAHAFAERLHALGCRLALDDFGTGYGTLTYLKRLPVDYLKLDIEFVRDLPSNSASRHVVQAVVSLARDFGLQTVAEGVEDADTLALLERLGVDLAQGYYIARPQPFVERPGEDATRLSAEPSAPAEDHPNAPRSPKRRRRSAAALVPPGD